MGHCPALQSHYQFQVSHWLLASQLSFFNSSRKYVFDFPNRSNALSTTMSHWPSQLGIIRMEMMLTKVLTLASHLSTTCSLEVPSNSNGSFLMFAVVVIVCISMCVMLAFYFRSRRLLAAHMRFPQDHLPSIEHLQRTREVFFLSWQAHTQTHTHTRWNLEILCLNPSSSTDPVCFSF